MQFLKEKRKLLKAKLGFHSESKIQNSNNFKKNKKNKNKIDININTHTFRKLLSYFGTKVVAMIIVISFIFLLLQEVLQSFNDNSWVIKADNFKYSATEWKNLFDYEVQKIQKDKEDNFNSNKAVDILNIRSRLVDQLINHAILLHEAKKMNFIISDDMVKYEIAGMEVFKDQKGKFDKKIFDEILKSNGMTESIFLLKLKEEMMRNQVLHLFSANYKSSPKELIESISQIATSKRLLSVYKFKYAKDPIKEKIFALPSDRELNDFISKHESFFRTPEKRVVSYFTISQADMLSTNFQISDEDIKSEYKRNIQHFLEKEKRLVNQLIFDTQQEAIKFKTQIEEHKIDYDTVTKMHQNEGKNYIANLGAVTRDGFNEQVGDLIFSLETNKITDPIQTPLGWHLFLVKEIYPEKTKNIDEVKEQILSEIMQEKRYEQFAKLIHEIERDLNSTHDINTISTKYNLKLLTQEISKQNDNNNNINNHNIDDHNIDDNTNDDINQSSDHFIKSKANNNNNKIYNVTNADFITSEPSFIETTFNTSISQISQLLPLKKSDIFFALQVNSVTPALLENDNYIKQKAMKYWIKEKNDRISAIAAYHQHDVLIHKIAEEKQKHDAILTKDNNLNPIRNLDINTENRTNDSLDINNPNNNLTNNSVSNSMINLLGKDFTHDTKQNILNWSSELYSKPTKFELSYNTSMPQDMTEALVQEVFTKMKLYDVSNVYRNIDGTYIFVKLEELIYPSINVEASKMMEDKVNKLFNEIIIDDYLSTLRSQHEVSVNVKLLDTITPIITTTNSTVLNTN